MTIAELRKRLDEFQNEQAEIFVQIGNEEFFPLCGKMDKILLTYMHKDDPTKKKYCQESLLLFPCKCESEEEDELKRRLNLN